MAQTNNTLGNWYTNAYSSGFRTNRLRAPSLVPNSRITAQAATVQQTLVVDAARQVGLAAGDKDDGKTIRRRETIFGPDVGEDDEPGWTKPEEGTKVSVDVVKGWVEKAKNEEGLHATTTLQALVNLKRPTLLLQQLETSEPQSTQVNGDITPRGPAIPIAPVHLLKFNYDATTPQVHIQLSIHPTPQPVVEGKESVIEEEVKVVYNGVHDGGFNQVFQLPPHAALDLSSAIAPISTLEGSAISLNGDDKNALGNDSAAARDQSLDTNRSSVEASMGNLHIASSTQPDLATVDELGSGAAPAEERRPARRFGLFGRRQREEDLEAANIEMANRAAEAEKAAAEEVKEPERGMRLLIRIEALGPTGDALQRTNAQLTHILINGMWVPDAGSSVTPGQGAGKRVWVVKVQRREAVIGAHTFLLKEIYGLSSAATAPAEAATYPPTAGAEQDAYASTPNECIVCLTSPRDVVLLPCRHLVVCRDCAMGMVEFGAGGKVARRDDTAAADTEGTAAGAGSTTAGGATGSAAAATTTTTTTGAAAPVAGGTTATGRERRKRKAKGWYCPVCRQPYTSLLRLALPSSGKSLDESDTVSVAPSHPHPHPHPHPAGRAASIRSVRSTHTLRRTPSHAPTLPDGAERMLESLRPKQEAEDNDDDAEDAAPVPESERPQFVLGPEVDADTSKGEVEHDENAKAAPASTAAFDNAQATEEGRAGGAKGWKEVA